MLKFFAASFCFCALLTLRAGETPSDAEKARSELEADPDIALALRMERAFQKLARRVAPAVVSLKVITRLKNVPDLAEYVTQGLPERNFEGSGVIVDSDGWIITNEHVIRGADKINVTFSDGRVCKAMVAGVDPRSDLAMLKLDKEGMPPNLAHASLADSDQVQVGQYAMAVGNPFGLSNSFTMGVVSARGRNMPLHSSNNDVFYGNLIQTDTPINPGNSGGPLFNLYGEVIGINTMIFSNTGYSHGCSFAIPANRLKPRIAYLKTNREIEYGWLGVELNNLADFQSEFKVPDNKGVLINGVIENTPADRAGLVHGMVVLEYDGTRVSNKDELIGAVNDTPVGRTVKMKVVNTSGNVADVNVKISKRYTELARGRTWVRDEESQALDLADIEGDAKPSLSKLENKSAQDVLAEKLANATKTWIWRGMMVKELSAEDGRKKGGRLEIVRVKKGSPADRAGLYEGAVLTEFKHGSNPAIQKLTSLDDLKRLSAQAPGSAAIYTPLDGFVTVEEK